MRSRRPLTLLALSSLLVASTATPAASYRPEATAARDLEAATSDALDHPAVGAAAVGLLVRRDGVPILGENPTRAFIPASLMKLATTVAAVDRFGPDHRFDTVVRAVGGTRSAPRDLVLVGGGDPTLSTEAYRRKRFLPKPSDRIQRPAFPNGSPTLERLASLVRDTGIRRITGDLIADESRFDTDRVPDGWPSRYFVGEPESSFLSALVANEGRTDLTRQAIVPDPARHAARLFRVALRDLGIRVDGVIRIGAAPRTSREVARISSPTVAELVDFINRYSANFQAEMLMKSLGASFGAAGSYAEAARVVRASLDGFAIDTGGLVMRDGSGLSRDDRMSARTIVDLLDAIRIRPRLAAVLSSLPIAGGPGTLERRLTRWPTGGNLRAKTGLLRGVRALAGILVDRDGATITYAAIFNGGASAIALGTPLDLLTVAFALHPTG